MGNYKDNDNNPENTSVDGDKPIIPNESDAVEPKAATDSVNTAHFKGSFYDPRNDQVDNKDGDIPIADQSAGFKR